MPVAPTLHKTMVKSDRFAHLNNFESKNQYDDSGNYPHIHYKTRINPLRYKARQFLLPFIRAETERLYNIQTSMRSDFLDFYFPYTANLASHTFYVLTLPLPIWFGYGKITRDLVFILGYGIYFTGFVKDFCCLPRPRSPPLHRITLSGYTAKEYGFPSSHSANATAFSLLMASLVLQNYDSFQNCLWLYLSLVAIAAYYFSLVIGRIYCGMHGFLDIIVGAVIGALCLLIRSLTADWWDHFITNSSIFAPILAVLINYSLIYFHISPVDDCPCFDDSIAFIGVIMGLEISSWVYANYFVPYGFENIYIPYCFEELGVIKSALRVTVGLILVVIWKELSKPFLFKLFSPIYRKFVKDDKEMARFNRIRSRTLSKDEKIGNVKEFIQNLSQTDKKDTIGPQSAIDLTELDELQSHSDYYEELKILREKNVLFTCSAFKKRYDIEIIVRLIVYAGITFVSIVIFSEVVKFLKLTPTGY
ncbi:hypothetical protein WICMUC_001540 [Wickerhamomyces mucosus]|uniref:Phosphatidic acid phosphatase type 2/haloperoxidase domain-containing protein n=1 Tax=Wickerhamomyces mucosus TaxID=1378264 RepID=A0A9P8PU96_9ASCO|nr:hypothetical protein WICMUC_001540 [Wickerhamomyces mucosus]